MGKKSLEQLGLFLEDFRQPSSRSLELDKEIIVELCMFLKQEKQSSMGKGLYEALYWLNKFISYFEQDYMMWLKDSEEMMKEPAENLDAEDKYIMD